MAHKYAKRAVGLMMVASLAASSYVLAAGSADETAIRKQYAICAQAFRNKNVARIINLETSDFTYVMVSGRRQSKISCDASLKDFVRRLLSVDTFQMKIRSLTTNSNSAVATVEQHESCSFADQRGKHHLVHMILSHDTWVKTRQGWRIRRSQEISDKATVDGKPIKTS